MNSAPASSYALRRRTTPPRIPPSGDLLANVWFQDRILRIDLESGNVKEVYEFSGLWPKDDRPKEADCFNGIAVDHERDTVYLTGKLWPKVYEVRLIAPP